MGPALQPPTSAPSKAFSNKNLSQFEVLFSESDETNEFPEFDSCEEVSRHPEASQINWPSKTIEAFRHFFNLLPPDEVFDSYDNRLTQTVKAISSDNELYCVKCFAMRPLKKHGKVKSTYQFECRNHKISAKQILENLPDELIVELIPTEPRAFFNSVLKWLSKDHLSPELVKLTTERNAVKRFSQSFDEDSKKCTSLIKARNVENGYITEAIGMKNRMASLEETVNQLAREIKDLAAVNSLLKQENKALLEENQLLKRHLSSPSPTVSTNTKAMSYADITTKCVPLKFYTKAGSQLPREIIEPAPTQSNINIAKISSTDIYSPLKFVYFEGCHRKTASTYRNMLPKIGIDAHWARDITFLAEDLVQITTFESKEQILIKAMESISPSVKHLRDFEPCIGKSYEKYGPYTDESAKKAYFALMEKNTERLKKDSKQIPSLKRVAAFFTKVVEAKNIKYQSPRRIPTIFCLGDFINIVDAKTYAKDKIETNFDMEIEPSQLLSQDSQDAHNAAKVIYVESTQPPNDQ
jgi:hypothetical protein